MFWKVKETNVTKAKYTVITHKIGQKSDENGVFSTDKQNISVKFFQMVEGTSNKEERRVRKVNIS